MRSDRQVDFRSDTVTLPTEGMRRAMAQAEVGDDVFGEDPSVNRLEERVAELLGFEAAMLVPSGTMSNQIGIHIHTRPNDELLCAESSHVCRYEAGGPAMLSGVTCRPIPTATGILDVEDFAKNLLPENVHFPRTRLVSLENTHNRGGGRVYPKENVDRICRWAHDHGLATHLDGARLLNAVVATGISARDYVSGFDTVSICFSKGLGAPIGSALAGSKERIHEARRARKVLGGGMRQAGVIAAACLYALDHHVERLAEDHANARLLAEAFAESPAFDLNLADVETNLLWVPVKPEFATAADVVAYFAEHGIRILAAGPQLIRLCTHLDITRDDCIRTAAVVRKFRG